jgi:hypothetical protein
MKGLLSVVIVAGLLVAGVAVALLFMVFSAAVRVNLSLVVTATLQAILLLGLAVAGLAYCVMRQPRQT